MENDRETSGPFALPKLLAAVFYAENRIISAACGRTGFVGGDAVTSAPRDGLAETRGSSCANSPRDSEDSEPSEAI